jgi:hypothetical protein
MRASFNIGIYCQLRSKFNNKLHGMHSLVGNTSCYYGTNHKEQASWPGVMYRCGRIKPVNGIPNPPILTRKRILWDPEFTFISSKRQPFLKQEGNLWPSMFKFLFIIEGCKFKTILFYRYLKLIKSLVYLENHCTFIWIHSHMCIHGNQSLTW